MTESAYKATYHSGRDIPNISGAGGGDNLVKEARDRAAAAWEYDRENREDGFVDLRFLAGDQWPNAIRLERETAGRPTITVNKLPQFMFQVANDIRTNPPGIKVVPATDDEESGDIADIYAGLIRSIENASGAADIYANAGGQAVACGQGNWRVNTRYVTDDVFDQELVLESIRHPFSVIWDPMAIHPARADAEWGQVTQLIHKEVYAKKYPGASMSSFDTPIPGQDPEAGLFWRNGDWIRLVEYWRKVDTKKKLVMFPGGEVINVTELGRGQMEQLVAELGEPIKERDCEGKKVRSSLLSAVDVLEAEEDWLGAHIPIITTIGGEIPLDTKVVRFGLIRFARDPQQLYNYARSAAAEAIGLAPKSPYLLTTKMISRYVAMWNSHNTTQRPYLVYDPDEAVPAGPQRLHPPETPVAFYEEQKIASEDMKATTGIYDASLGARGNETSGVAINARDRQGDTATAHFQSNLVTSMMHCGRVMIDLIPKVYDTERTERIMGEDDTEEFKPINHVVLSDRGEPILLNDLSQGRYEVRPRTGPSYTTKRLEAGDSMLAFAQAVPNAAALIGDLIAKNMDWPGADEIAERLKRMLPPQALGDEDKKDGEEETPEAMAAKQAADTMAKLQAEQVQLQMREQKAKIEKIEAETKRIGGQGLDEKLDMLVKIMQAMATGMLQDPAQLKPAVDSLDALAGGQAPPDAGAMGGNAMSGGMGSPDQMQPPVPPSGGMQPPGEQMQGGMEIPAGREEFLGGAPQPESEMTF